MLNYIYQAEIYCEDCGKSIRDELIKQGKAPENPDYDSDQFPKGPYDPGESDCPAHCGSHGDCINAITLSDGTKIGAWLENELTRDGVEYVKEYIRDDPDSEVVKLWASWYDIPIPEPEPLEVAMVLLEECLDEINHAVDCPYRHSGPCECLRSEIIQFLNENRI